MQVELAPDIHPSIGEAPNLELVLLADSKDGLMLLKFMDLLDLLLMHIEPRVDMLDLFHPHEDH